MSDDTATRRFRNGVLPRRGGLSEEHLARADPFIREALTENKRQGLVLAVRARWTALAVVAVWLPFFNFRWEVLYYEAAVVVFALIGWAQLRGGRGRCVPAGALPDISGLDPSDAPHRRSQSVQRGDLAHRLPV